MGQPNIVKSMQKINLEQTHKVVICIIYGQFHVKQLTLCTKKPINLPVN